VKILDPPDRVIKPRKQNRLQMTLATCDDNLRVKYEGNLEIEWELVEFMCWLYYNWPKREDRRRDVPVMLVCHNPQKAFLTAHNAFNGSPGWQARVTVHNNDFMEPAHKVQSADNVFIRLFGWQLKNRHTRYLHPISPLSFMDDWDGDLMEWGAEIRKWILDNQLRFSPTRGGLAAQLLRDPRFYPAARRKVPKLTNERARNAMPGNYYASIRSDKVYGKVYLIDQENAHHYAAKTVKLPDPNTLTAKGRYRSLYDKIWIAPGSEAFNHVIREHGLFRMRVFVPNYLMGALPPWAEYGKLQNVNIYSNELPLLSELGVEIRHVARAYTSPGIDTGLAKYAEWAEKQHTSKNRAWVKPMLLSAYGILGAKPRRLESAYLQSEKGKPTNYFLGPHPIRMKQIKTSRHIQSPVANVIHRGMIEAETRKLSIELARKLEAVGHSVLGIHADAVLVHDEGQQMPLLPAPWRVKHELSRFRAIDNVSFQSDALTILPGRSKNDRKIKTGVIV
jgi:hypothetical protein